MLNIMISFADQGELERAEKIVRAASKVYERVGDVIRRKRGMRPSEKAMALAEAERNSRMLWAMAETLKRGGDKTGS